MALTNHNKQRKSKYVPGTKCAKICKKPSLVTGRKTREKYANHREVSRKETPKHFTYINETEPWKVFERCTS